MRAKGSKTISSDCVLALTWLPEESAIERTRDFIQRRGRGPVKRAAV